MVWKSLLAGEFFSLSSASHARAISLPQKSYAPKHKLRAAVIGGYVHKAVVLFSHRKCNFPTAIQHMDARTATTHVFVRISFFSFIYYPIYRIFTERPQRRKMSAAVEVTFCLFLLSFPFCVSSCFPLLSSKGRRNVPYRP